MDTPILSQQRRVLRQEPSNSAQPFTEGTPATGITVAGDRVTGVETGSGRISAPVVVNATGPWSATVASWAGIDIPITVTREQDILLRCR